MAERGMVERGCHAACVHEHGDNLTEGSSLLTANAKKAWEPFVRAILTAALSEQAVVPKEPTSEMLDAAFVNGPLPMTGLDGSEQAQRERETIAEIYRAMIAAAPPREVESE